MLIPSITEQKVIVQFLERKTSEIVTLIIKTHISIEKLQEYRRSLITVAVTGKVDVNHLEQIEQET